MGNKHFERFRRSGNIEHTNDSLIGEIKKTELKRTEDSAKIEAIIQELEKDPKFKDSMNTLRIKLENKINK